MGCYYYVLQVCDHIVMIYCNIDYGEYYAQTNRFNFEVYCIDLSKPKIFKCSNVSQIGYLNIYSRSNSRYYLITCNDNMAHFIGEKYYKWSINKMIPQEIKDENDLLVMGYIKKTENQNQFSIVPIPIKILILKFYSKFHAK